MSGRRYDLPLFFPVTVSTRVPPLIRKCILEFRMRTIAGFTKRWGEAFPGFRSLSVTNIALPSRR